MTVKKERNQYSNRRQMLNYICLKAEQGKERTINLNLTSDARSATSLSPICLETWPLALISGVRISSCGLSGRGDNARVVPFIRHTYTKYFEETCKLHDTCVTYVVSVLPTMCFGVTRENELRRKGSEDRRISHSTRGNSCAEQTAI